MDISKWKERKSFHYFLYPFVLEDKGNIRKLYDILKSAPCWVEEDNTGLGELVDYDLYTERKYFNEQARLLIYGEEADTPQGELPIVNRLKFIPAGGGSLTMGKQGKDYHLDIMEIRLNLYEVGVAMMVFGFAAPEDVRYGFDEVLLINQTLRRLFPPFIPDEAKESENPDKLALHLVSKHESKECDVVYKIARNDKEKELYVDSYEKELPELIKAVLYFDMEEDKQRKIEGLGIRLILDDRMHVMSLVRNNGLSEIIKGYEVTKGDYDIYTQKSLMDLLYKYCFVDKPEGLSCQNLHMEQSLLKEAIYDRWIDYGTIHGVTHHSMVCLTGEDKTWDVAAKPFLTEYVQMQMIALLQRTSIRYFADKVSKISSNIKTYNVDMDTMEKETQMEIMNLQQMFLKCKNQILLDEVTSQEQGVELFDRMRNALYITKEIDALDNKINDLNQLASMDYDIKNGQKSELTNKLINRLTVWSIPLAALALIVTALQTDPSWLDGAPGVWLCGLNGAQRISLAISILMVVMSVVYIVKALKLSRELNGDTKKERKWW